MNIWNIAKTNINLYGHYECIYKDNEPFKYRKFADYGGFTWIRSVKNCFICPTDEQSAFFKSQLIKRLRTVKPIDFIKSRDL